eukprot:7175873-Alexandrium_andersonii.AAC.1
MEASASWRCDLSGHACLIAKAAEVSRRCGDCPPHRLRQLPPEAWAELRTEYAALHLRFGAPR